MGGYGELIRRNALVCMLQKSSVQFLPSGSLFEPVCIISLPYPLGKSRLLKLPRYDYTYLREVRVKHGVGLQSMGESGVTDERNYARVETWRQDRQVHDPRRVG